RVLVRARPAPARRQLRRQFRRRLRRLQRGIRVTKRPAEPPQPGPYVHDPVACQQVAESRRMISAVAEIAQPGQALVLGAGHCAEIPLVALVERFERVTLNDVQAEPLEEGIALAALSDRARAKIDVRVADLTGSNETILAQI